MKFSLGSLVAVASTGAAVASAAPAQAHHGNKLYFSEEKGVNYTVFEHAATGASMKFVKNSGICETTPGVNQYSGYLSVGTNQNMWFWFFEARNSPTTAPLATWFNGGPGCSSMIGLFQVRGGGYFSMSHAYYFG
jgi:carboxypeptidase C (cathepsin A)